MNLTRRTVLQGAGAGLASSLASPGTSWAASGLRVGDIRIDTLSDGSLSLPADFIFGPMPQEDLAPIRARHGLMGDTLSPECNLTLLRDGTNTVLFDAGSGQGFQQTAGQVGDALAAIGLDPADITHVVFTHAHPDHLWGILDDFDDPYFYEAEHMIGRAEWEYWTHPDTPASIGDARTTMAVGAARRLAAMDGALTLFEAGDQILPGVSAVGSQGHTPGHMSFALHSGSDAVMVLGDAIGNHHVAFEQPAWPSGSDQDRDTAAITRQRLLDQIVADDMRLIGFHLPGGGIGRAERSGSGYRFVPDPG